MKRVLLIILLTGLSLSLYAQEELPVVTIDRFPQTIDEFVEMRNEIAVTPEGGAAMFVIAIITYTRDPDLGELFLTAILVNDGSHLRNVKHDEGYSGYLPSVSVMNYIRMLDPKPFIARSYVLGTSPENRYILPESGPFSIQCYRNSYSDVDEVTRRIFVACSGADSPRPIRVVQNNRGLWKIDEFSSLVVGIRPPAEPERDDDL
jgi:hypothetical protein